MSLWLLYFLLLKATATSFSAVSALPVVRDEFVLKRNVLADLQLYAGGSQLLLKLNQFPTGDTDLNSESVMESMESRL
jgi:hypothetical protein